MKSPTVSFFCLLGTLLIVRTGLVRADDSPKFAMARQLERYGVPHELITVKGGGHSLWGGEREKIDQAFERSLQFIRQQLSQ